MDDKRPIEFAQTDEIDRREALAGEFINQVLRLPWAFLSNGSTLADFEGVRTEAELSQACYERYGLGLESRHFEMPLYMLLDELEAARKRRDLPN